MIAIAFKFGALDVLDHLDAGLHLRIVEVLHLLHTFGAFHVLSIRILHYFAICEAWYGAGLSKPASLLVVYAVDWTGLLDSRAAAFHREYWARLVCPFLISSRHLEGRVRHDGIIRVCFGMRLAVFGMEMIYAGTSSDLIHLFISAREPFAASLSTSLNLLHNACWLLRMCLNLWLFLAHW